MALIPCPECGRMVSPNAEECPHCGAPVKQLLASRTTKHYPSDESNELLSAAKTTADKKTNTNVVPESGSAKQNKKSKLPWILVSTFVIVLAIAAVAIYYYRVGNGSSPKEPYYKTYGYTLKGSQRTVADQKIPQQTVSENVVSETVAFVEMPEETVETVESDDWKTDYSYYDNEPYLVDLSDDGI